MTEEDLCYQSPFWTNTYTYLPMHPHTYANVIMYITHTKIHKNIKSQIFNWAWNYCDQLLALHNGDVSIVKWRWLFYQDIEIEHIFHHAVVNITITLNPAHNTEGYAKTLYSRSSISLFFFFWKNPYGIFLTKLSQILPSSSPTQIHGLSFSFLENNPPLYKYILVQSEKILNCT